MIKVSVKEEMKAEYRRIRENNLLILGVLIGIIGSLTAGVVNDLVRTSTFYPWLYLLFLTILLLVLIIIFLRRYIYWKIFLYRMNKWMKNAKKVLDRTKNSV